MDTRKGSRKDTKRVGKQGRKKEKWTATRKDMKREAESGEKDTGKAMT
jgi:hypothetical protein